MTYKYGHMTTLYIEITEYISHFTDQ